MNEVVKTPRSDSSDQSGVKVRVSEHTEDRTHSPKYPGIETVIHGNGAVAHVMGHVCGGVIGYPITPSTEIAELFEAYRAKGGCNVWGEHPFFFEPEGEHSAQSGAMGASLVGGRYISNASSSQGILYGLESHYVTVGKKVGGFVLQVAARAVSRHSLNVMAGHDDVYALLNSGYTILFGSNPQEAADLAAISYRVSALSMVPVCNAMDGFATSHMQCETRLPEPELLKTFLGDPAGRIEAPTEAQKILYGAKGRTYQLQQYLSRHKGDFDASSLSNLQQFLLDHSQAVEDDNQGNLIEQTLDWVPQDYRAQWKRQWVNAYARGSRQRVPAMLDVNNPGLTGGVQNQPDFQAGTVDHNAHFVSDVQKFVHEAMNEYEQLTGRKYLPVMTFNADDAEYVVVALGSVTDDAEAVTSYLRKEGQKVGVVSIKQLHPFPEAELVEAVQGKKAITILERSENTALTKLVTQALFKAKENHDVLRHKGIPAIGAIPKISTGIFGLGGHDLQPRHLMAVYKNMQSASNVPFFWLGSQFYQKSNTESDNELQQRLRIAYPENELMALTTEENPHLLPDSALRIRFHSVGGYGTIATGKLLTDILSGVLNMHSKSAPKYGSEKSGSPTNFYITLSPEPIKITNAELEAVEIVVSPDHKVFNHTNPLNGLVENGTLVLQSHHTPIEVWQELPSHIRQIIRDRNIKFYIVDAFAVAKKNAPEPQLEIRMMGVAFIGALCGHLEQIASGKSEDFILEKIESQIRKKFSSKGEAVVLSNMQVVKEGLAATLKVDYSTPEFLEAEQNDNVLIKHGIEVSAALNTNPCKSSSNGIFSKAYYDRILADPFKKGTIAESPVMPGSGLFMPSGTAAWKDKGLFRLNVPVYEAQKCTGCMECAVVCPDAAIPNTVHDIHDLLLKSIESLDTTKEHKASMAAQVHMLDSVIRGHLRDLPAKDERTFADIVDLSVKEIETNNPGIEADYATLVENLRSFPVAVTRPFFQAMEKRLPGTGGLYSVNIDPWKCTGCLECVDVCGPGALSTEKQSSKLQGQMSHRLAFLNNLPNTPSRFTDDALSNNEDVKRILLDRKNYYAMTGGHGACRGCGEVTAIRMLTAINHARYDIARTKHIRELESLIDALQDKMESVESTTVDPNRVKRMQASLQRLEKRLYLFESGPTGNGPSPQAIANATGCSSVYASTFPANPYKDPWVNSLFQDTPAVAKGVFEAVSASATKDFAAMRTARLDLEDQYDPDYHDTLYRCFNWHHFSKEELELLPSVISMGGDGAMYDIGFGALSRVLVSETPLKVIILNTGAYSNTGGQTSTASYTAQDSDLTRFGVAHRGKHEHRKELGLIASFHPNVLVIQTNAGLQAHFLKNALRFFQHNDRPAIFDTYTACQPEHGIADDASSRREVLAVQSRMSPVFVHDPGKGETLAERFSIEGNPDIGQDWVNTTLAYIDENGDQQLMEIPYTAADFAFQEGRFNKHFHQVNDDDNPVPIHEYLDLEEHERYESVPFIWSVNDEQKLIKLTMTSAMVELTLERRTYWRMLEYLAGLHVDKLHERHLEELRMWTEKYAASNQAREASIDSIARSMAELASSTDASVIPVKNIVPERNEPDAVVVSDVSSSQPLVEILEADMSKCTNCKTCYQDLPELFEKTKIVEGGEVMEVSRVIPGALDKVQITPELQRKASRVADDCDVEIIRYHAQS